MKIGIITFWGVPNYGAFLQAYALKHTVESLNHKIEVQLIPYLNNLHYNQYYSIIPNNNIRALKNIIKRIRNYSSIKANKNNFINAYINLSGEDRITVNELQKREYDCIILGSDIIWDYTISFFGEDLFLFGNQLKAKNIISYAASFGTAPLEKELPEYVLKGINNISSISVRDKKSELIINKYFKRQALQMPDPTLLWDFENDKNFSLPNNYGDYIVIYGSHFSENHIKDVIIYAKEHNYKIICLDSGGDNFNWCDINLNQNNLSPFEWVNIYKNAKAIMTCTFHGLLFGLIFRKPIAFELTDFIRPKVSSLINDLNLETPLINMTSFKEKIEWNWNYDSIYKSIIKVREKGLLYLKENIHI